MRRMNKVDLANMVIEMAAWLIILSLLALTIWFLNAAGEALA